MVREQNSVLREGVIAGCIGAAVVAVGFVIFEVFFLALEGALGQSVFGALVSWSVLIGNFLAAVAMLGYFLTRHRTLPRLLVGAWWDVLREGTIAGLVGAAMVALWFLAI